MLVCRKSLVHEGLLYAVVVGLWCPVIGSGLLDHFFALRPLIRTGILRILGHHILNTCPITTETMFFSPPQNSRVPGRGL